LDERKTQHWAVTVERNGQKVVTLSSNHLSGRDLSEQDLDVIRLAGENLLAFAGKNIKAEGRNVD